MNLRSIIPQRSFFREVERPSFQARSTTMAAPTMSSARRRRAGNKFIALVLWGLSCYATYQFFVSLAGTGPGVFFIATIAQITLSFSESPMWRGDISGGGVIALAFDTFTNIGGTFYYIGNLEKTASWQAFTTTFGAQPDVTGYTQLFISIVVGMMLAAAPEALWKQS